MCHRTAPVAVLSMENFKNRLLEFVESREMSQRGFEECCGLTQGTIASIKVKGPSVDVLMRISNTFPELNMNWLVAGRGRMIEEETEAAAQQVVIKNWDGLAEAISRAINIKQK